MHLCTCLVLLFVPTLDFLICLLSKPLSPSEHFTHRLALWSSSLPALLSVLGAVYPLSSASRWGPGWMLTVQGWSVPAATSLGAGVQAAPHGWLLLQRLRSFP